MATLVHFNIFAEDLLKGIHDFTTHVYKVALTNTAPSASNAVLADITEIAYTNLSARTLTITSVAQTSGVAPVIITDLTISASGGSAAAFRYAVVYNDTSTGDRLVGYVDRGSSITLASGDSCTLDFDGTNGATKVSFT